MFSVVAAMSLDGSPLDFWLLPRDAAMHGVSLDKHLLLNLWTMLALVALAHVVLGMGLLRRRHYEAVQAQTWVEWVPMAALALLFAFLTVQAEHLWAAERYTGADPAALQIEVTGMQFAWYFRYPGKDAAFGTTRPELIAPGEGNPLGIDPKDRHAADDFVASELVVPVGQKVDLLLRAQDVIHGFAVPEMRLKQNAVPGLTTHVHFTPITEGSYAVMCTQLCGLGHYRMEATLRVVSAAEFAAWVSKHEAAAAALHDAHGGER